MMSDYSERGNYHHLSAHHTQANELAHKQGQGTHALFRSIFWAGLLNWTNLLRLNESWAGLPIRYENCAEEHDSSVPYPANNESSGSDSDNGIALTLYIYSLDKTIDTNWIQGRPVYLEAISTSCRLEHSLCRWQSNVWSLPVYLEDWTMHSLIGVSYKFRCLSFVLISEAVCSSVATNVSVTHAAAAAWWLVGRPPRSLQWAKAIQIQFGCLWTDDDFTVDVSPTRPSQLMHACVVVEASFLVAAAHNASSIGLSVYICME